MLLWYGPIIYKSETHPYTQTQAVCDLSHSQYWREFEGGWFLVVGAPMGFLTRSSKRVHAHYGLRGIFRGLSSICRCSACSSLDISGSSWVLNSSEKSGPKCPPPPLNLSGPFPCFPFTRMQGQGVSLQLSPPPTPCIPTEPGTVWPHVFILCFAVLSLHSQYRLYVQLSICSAIKGLFAVLFSGTKKKLKMTWLISL